MVKCKQESISKINGLTYKELWGVFFKSFQKLFLFQRKPNGGIVQTTCKS